MGCSTGKNKSVKYSQDLTMLAYTSKVEGHYDTALKLFSDILQTENNQINGKKKDDIKIAQTYSHIADIHLQQKNYILALQNYNNALNQYIDINGQQNKVTNILKIKIGKCQLHLKQSQLAYQNLYESLSQNVKLPEKIIIEALALLSLISDEELKTGNFENAIKIKTKTHQLSSQYFGDQDIVSMEIQNQLNKQLLKQNTINKQIEQKISMTESKRECAICYEILNDDTIIPCCQLSVCKHQYHVQCIQKWFLKDMSCPVCRRKLSQ